MSVVDSRVNGDRSGRTGVLVDLLVEDGLQLIVAHVRLVQDDMIVRGARSALDGGVGAEVEVIFMRMDLEAMLALETAYRTVGMHLPLLSRPMSLEVGFRCGLPSLGRSEHGDACRR
jgi:hypothetical protein